MALPHFFPENKLFLAPMAGITDLPFRLIARQYRCLFAFSEMVNANGLVLSSARSRGYLKSRQQDKPFGVQIFGADPTIMAEAAKIIEQSGADLVDINCGCPVRKVAKVGAGAVLMKTPRLVGEIVATVRHAVSIPVSIKIRSGWNEQNAEEVALVAQEAGATMITVHPRLAKQGFSGVADWTVTKRIKEILRIPVIGNGDVRSLADFQAIVGLTKCDGVMVGRGAWGSPWIFTEIAQGISTGEETKYKTIIEHLDLVCTHYGKQKGVKIFRAHLLAYIRNRRGSSAFRRTIATVNDKQEIESMLQSFWHC
ncbi:MAG: tRNA dihydrouridine synthase DusB [Deltaproteobacteria bacterium]|nr:tRNA dihydrouridine synthase DusB [Deltaproteobacteria bacterium]